MKISSPRIVCCILSILVLSLHNASADNPAPATESKSIIGSIQTTGNRGISTTEILAKIRSRTGEIFDPNMAAEDAKRIAELAGVEYSYYNSAPADGKIKLTFVIVEKNIIRSITFVGNHSYKTTTLQKKLDFKVADYLDTAQAQASAATLAEFYRKNGYVFAQVNLDSGKLAEGKLAYTIDEGARVKIGSVKFTGNKSLKTRELKRVIKTKKNKFVFWPNYYSEEQLTADMGKLQSVYYDRGFLNASVTTKQEFSKDKKKARITFVIDEGPAYKIDKIALAGNKFFDDKTILPQLKSKEGLVYREKKAQADVKHILKLYRQDGFIDATVEQKREFASKDTVDVKFDITEGERFRIGKVDITGNEQTQDKVIRRVLDEYDFQPGQWYNADTARGDGNGELEKTVKNTVLLENITITPAGKKPGQRDAAVNVAEGQTGMVMVGAGIASDSGVIGQLSFEQRNFDITDKPKSFGDLITGQAYKGAGQNFRIALEPGTEVSQYSISFSDPYFKDKPVSFEAIGSSYERGFESYDEKRLKGFTGFEKRDKDHRRRSIGFKVENVNVGSLEPDAPQEIRDVEGDNLLASVIFGIGRDLTDSRFTPSKGSSYNLSYEQTGGDHTFGILSGIYRHYFTLYEDLAERKTILATRLQAATTVGNAPPFEKFYAGGSSSIRGFDYRGVSTRGLQTNVANPKREDPIGSDWIFLANAEVAVPLISENFSWLFFVDSGVIDTGGYRASVGTGIQILIPQWFGPVPMRFEIAAPFMKAEDDDTQVFSFSIGRLF
jgi:outer membrane protein insertion porin family